MIANSGLPRMSPQGCLVWEGFQPLRYEYLKGGTIPHNQVAVNLASDLKNHLRGKGCKVLSSDAKVAGSDRVPFHCADIQKTGILQSLD